MALGVETPRNTYVGNGSTTVFPLEFTYDNQSEVQVYLSDVLQSSGFIVNLNDVTFVTPPEIDVSIALLRSTPLDQPSPFEDPQKTTLAEIEVSVDRVVRQLQEREDKFDRAPVLPRSSTPASRASTSVGFDANGEPVSRDAQAEREFIGVGPQFDQAVTAAAAASMDAQRAENAKNALLASLPTYGFNFTSEPVTFNFLTS